MKESIQKKLEDICGRWNIKMNNLNWNQIAVGNYTYPLYSFEYFLDSMVRFNIKNIEVWAAGPHLYLEDMNSRIIQQMNKEIKIRGLVPICLTPEQCKYPINIGAEELWIRKRSVEYFEKGLQVAEELGIDKMIVTPGNGYRDRSSEITRKYTVENLQYLSEKAKEKHITLLLEHLTIETTNLATTAEELKKLCQEINNDNLIAMVDTDMMSRYGETVADYMEVFNGEIGHVHFVDGFPGGHLAIGDGVLPMEQFLNELSETEYKGYISLEIISDRYHLDPNKAIEKSLQWFSQRIK